MPGEAGRPSRGREVFSRVCWTVVGTGVVALALVGTAVSDLSTVVLVGPVCGALLAGMVALTVDGPVRHLRRRRLQVAAAAAGLLLVPFLAGTALLGVVGAGLASTLVALGVVAAVVRTGSRGGRSPLPPQGAAPDVPPRRSIPIAPTAAFVPLMSTSKLLQEWHSSSALLSDPAALRRLQAVRLREAVLDELTRRHPDAVERWLRHQRDDDLQRSIGEDPDRAV